ncbi:MAG: sel1 repeat family protein [Rickettsiaceae bacterium]|nr:sel1 repeat family protein [Rickettsiaceae bacterium]
MTFVIFIQNNLNIIIMYKYKFFSWKIIITICFFVLLNSCSEPEINYSCSDITNLEKLANEKNDPTAQTTLALCYKDGENIEKDLVKAAELLQKSADQGHAAAQNILALMYYHGDGVSKDLKKSVGLFQKAADQGYAYCSV